MASSTQPVSGVDHENSTQSYDRIFGAKRSSNYTARANRTEDSEEETFCPHTVHRNSTIVSTAV